MNDDPGNPATSNDDGAVYELLHASDLSPALKRTIKGKRDRGELDEVDAKVFEKNLRKTVKNSDVL